MNEPVPEWPADKVVRRKVGDLAPSARNARTHSPEQVEQLAASIQHWGWTVPVLVDEAGRIIAGHGRVLAAQRLGLDTVPVMIATGWTEQQKQAYVIADNQLALNSDWDQGLLAEQLTELDAAGFDTALVGLELPNVAASLDPKEAGVKRIAVDRVADRFWLAVSGPLAHQADALAAFKVLAAKLPGLDVEIGTVKRDA